MRNRKGILALVVLASLWMAFSPLAEPDWGFFGHRRINRLAVFTLPPELIGFYKKHLEYVTEHAVDPDKRRYATKHEGVRHYIDIDHWGAYPFDNVPRRWSDALLKFAAIETVSAAGDTLRYRFAKARGKYADPEKDADFITFEGVPDSFQNSYGTYFRQQILPQYYEDNWMGDCDSLRLLFTALGVSDDCQSVRFLDQFSGYGILPYHLEKTQARLSKAFREQDVNRILQLSADFGHYLADAHVPLHTTENYNGQLTNQRGIHAFWESRLVELYADRNFDYFVGKAEYIDDPNEYYWDIVLKSHSLVDSVLNIEKRLSMSFPEDQQYCYEERLERTIRTQCEAYARAYYRELEGMVEEQMRDAIKAIGDAWYTAWVDAGQPDLSGYKEAVVRQEEPAIAPDSRLDGRGH